MLKDLGGTLAPGKARIERSSPSLITEINDLLFRSSSQIVSA
jgi:hypothetical protein